MKNYIINLDYWLTDTYEDCQKRLENDLMAIRKDEYQPDERIVFHHTGDIYVKNSQLGLVLRNVQTIVNSNFPDQFDFSASGVVYSSDPSSGNAILDINNNKTDDEYNNEWNYDDNEEQFDSIKFQ